MFLDIVADTNAQQITHISGNTARFYSDAFVVRYSCQSTTPTDLGGTCTTQYAGATFGPHNYNVSLCAERVLGLSE